MSSQLVLDSLFIHSLSLLLSTHHSSAIATFEMHLQNQNNCTIVARIFIDMRSLFTYPSLNKHWTYDPYKYWASSNSSRVQCRLQLILEDQISKDVDFSSVVCGYIQASLLQSFEQFVPINNLLTAAPFMSIASLVFFWNSWLNDNAASTSKLILQYPYQLVNNLSLFIQISSQQEWGKRPVSR